MNGPPATASALLESAPCALVVTLTDGEITHVNAMFCAWTGYSAEELVGHMRFQQLLSVGGRVFHQTHWGPLLQMQGSVAEVKVEITHRDGHRVPMLLNAARHLHGETACHQLALLVVNDRHKYERELMTARDKLRDVNAKLSDASRMKTEFLATLAHELRNPLAPIRNGLQILKTAERPEVLDRVREMMERQVGHMVRLIDDLMDISRIANGKLELRKSVLTLRQIVDSATETSAPFIAAGGQTLSVDIPAMPIHLDADLTRISQVMSNILNNAAKFTPAGGTIVLSAEAERDAVVVRVADTGIGIASDKLERVFDMFGQLESTLHRTQGGLGIGLALSRTLVTMHGGSIIARSAGISYGSVSEIRLPTTSPPAGRQVEPIAPRLLRPLRILVTDDNVDNAESLALLLSAKGHIVRMAMNGADCLRMGADRESEVILLDIGLPDIDGYDVARRLRAGPSGRDLTLIALTGWGSSEDRRLSIEAGFDRHFTKPVDIDDLTSYLAERLTIV